RSALGGADEVLDGDALRGVDGRLTEAELLDEREDLVVLLHLVELFVEGVAQLLVEEAEATAAELLLAVDHRDEAFGGLEPAATLDLVHDGRLGERDGVDAIGFERVEEVRGLGEARDLAVGHAGVERV